jgi:phytoene dehydrogenase-like protein
MSKKCDVIVIGGGPGGLTCGALLAKWGLKVLLIEKNEYTGGKAVTPTNKDGFVYVVSESMLPERLSCWRPRWVSMSVPASTCLSR